MAVRPDAEAVADHRVFAQAGSPGTARLTETGPHAEIDPRAETAGRLTAPPDTARPAGNELAE